MIGEIVLLFTLTTSDGGAQIKIENYPYTSDRHRQFNMTKCSTITKNLNDMFNGTRYAAKDYRCLDIRQPVQGK